MEFRVFVNETKGTVAVKAVDPMQELYEEFANFYRKYNVMMDFNVFNNFSKLYRQQIMKMAGIATCNFSEGDVFDREYGESLAKERYLKNFESYRILMYDFMADKLTEMANAASKRLGICVSRRIDRDETIFGMMNLV